MNLNLYQVTVPLECGYTANLMVTAPTEDAAKRDAFKILHGVAEPRGNGDVMRYCFDGDEATVAEIDLAPPPMSDEAAARQLDRAERLFDEVAPRDGKRQALFAVLALAYARAAR